MNVSVGKFFSKMFSRKQSAPTKVERKVAPQLERKEDYTPPSKWRSWKWIGKHNALQAEKAKKRLKGRKKNRVQKKNRRINREGGKR